METPMFLSGPLNWACWLCLACAVCIACAELDGASDLAHLASITVATS
jgi:hypothetical protein